MRLDAVDRDPDPPRIYKARNALKRADKKVAQAGRNVAELEDSDGVPVRKLTTIRKIISDVLTAMDKRLDT